MSKFNFMDILAFVARNKNGGLFMYLDYSPIRSKEHQIWEQFDTSAWYKIDDSLYPNVTWDSEPLLINLYSKEV